MFTSKLKFLVCPSCKTDLKLNPIVQEPDERIKEGELKCTSCSKIYSIINYIPRFTPIDNYTTSFGFQWNKHAKTQYDSYSGINESETRFFKETKWERDLQGQLILEAGCGSGRFTEQVLKTGAMVISFDFSKAVEANYQAHWKNKNILFLQADIFNMPFREKSFDKVFCLGVIQHTPDPYGALMNLFEKLKPGGHLTADVYTKKNRLWWARTVEKFCSRINPEKLYRIVDRYIDFIWHFSSFINKFPYGHWLNWNVFMIADYRGEYPLSEKILKEWAKLDSFDMISPIFTLPQSLDTVNGWLKNEHFYEAEAHYGYNGIEIRLKRK